MNLDYQKTYWENFSSSGEKNFLAKDLHDSWDDKSQSYTQTTEINPHILEILKSETKMEFALDFGVGMGRNFKYLQTLYKNVYGFDLPAMIRNARSLLNNDQKLIDDWDFFRSRKFDLVYESVVMQHIPPQEVIHRLQCISEMSPYFVSWTRSYNDYLRDFQAKKYGVNMASLIKSTGSFEIVYCSLNENEITNLMDETHYNILYKSKNFK